MSLPTVTEIRDTSANPAPLGLLGFGMTTVLLNCHNAGFFTLNAMILAMGIFYGGIGQIIAGIQEWKKNNTFGATAFTSYGLFWLSLAALVLLPKSPSAAAPADATAMGVYLAIWGVFTFGMFIGTLRLSRALQFIFATLTILFFLLAVGECSGRVGITTFAGYEGIVCGLSAMYAGLAQVINELYGRIVLPLGSVPKPSPHGV
jgi:succinate-acetate transporter protein